MEAGLRVAHLVATAVWTGALLILIFSPRGRAPLLYRLLVAPGFFATALTGIWLLHREPALLRVSSFHLKLGAVALLMVADQLALRGGTRRPFALLAAALSLVAIAVATSLLG